MMQSRNSPCLCGSGKKYKFCCLAEDREREDALRRTTVRELPRKQQVHAPALVVCMPTRGRVAIETVTSLSRLDGIPSTMRTVSRMPVSQARNALAKMAIQAPNLAHFVPMSGWYVLWVDDDAFWRHGTIETALATLLTHREKVDILAGWFGPRAENAAPAVRFEDGSWPRPGTNCEFGDLVEVHRCGFHFVLHSIEVLEKVGEGPFTLAEGDEAEDFAFCRRAREAGLRIWTLPGLDVAHIGDDGSAYLPGSPAHDVVNGELLKREQPQIRSYGADVDLAVKPLTLGRV